MLKYNNKFVIITSVFTLLLGTSYPNEGFTATASGKETVTEVGNSSCGNDGALEAIAKIESAGAGGYKAVNYAGFLGKYQIGEGKLQDLGYAAKDGNYKDNKFQWTQKAKDKFGISSNQDFLNNTDAQEKIYAEINKLNISYLGNANNAIGQTMGGCGKTIDQTSLLAGAQLGADKVRKYIQNGNRCIPGKSTGTNDANGTCVEKFMCATAGCNPVEKDMSKKTCDVVMPMIEGITCSNMPSNMQGFCNTYRPYLMTRSECASAEAMSEKANKGPNKEQCENQTFGPGTGSWSYVLACSYGSDFVADQDGVENSNTGPMSDPACVEKLKGMGVNPRVMGQYNYSSGGQSCLVENAVSVNGAAVPFGRWVTMTCDMAVAMENWGQQLKGLGVTGYTDVQSLSCRRMRTAKGVKNKMSEHSYGRAVDVPGLIVGGRRISFGAIHQPATAEGAIVTQAKAFACSTFRQVLSPTYKEYAGTYVHFHVEWGLYRGCF